MKIDKIIEMHRMIDISKFKAVLNCKYPMKIMISEFEYMCDILGFYKDPIILSMKDDGWIITNNYLIHLNYIDNLDELEAFIVAADIDIKELTVAIVNEVLEKKGCLSDISLNKNFSLNILMFLLSLQDKLIPVKWDYWVIKDIIPEQLLYLRREVYKGLNLSLVDELISIFIRNSKPLKIEEIILNYFGYVFLDNKGIQNIFEFIYLVLDFTYHKETGYYIPKCWSKTLDFNLISKIERLLDLEGVIHKQDLFVKFTNTYTEKDIINNLEIWPDFVRDEFGFYRLRNMNINGVHEEKIRFATLDYLKSQGKSTFKALFNYLVQYLSAYSIELDFPTVKRFIKSCGDFAIISNNVYLMDKAPLDKMRLGDVAYIVLKDSEVPLSYAELEEAVKKIRGYEASISSVFLSEPKLSRPSRGYWALREWGYEEYNPNIHKEMENKLFEIIKNIGRPTHKYEIRAKLKEQGIVLNEGTLHLDLIEHKQIEQVAKGVYCLKEWNLSFRDLFNYRLPFRLTIPDGNPFVLKEGNKITIEYYISKQCLEIGRIILKKYFFEYFFDKEEYDKIFAYDIEGLEYNAWIEKISTNKFQIAGLKYWMKTNQVRYGETIYIQLDSSNNNEIYLFNAKQSELQF